MYGSQSREEGVGLKKDIGEIGRSGHFIEAGNLYRPAHSGPSAQYCHKNLGASERMIVIGPDLEVDLYFRS